FYTNTSAEYHRGDASLIHTDPDGQRDAALGPYTRVYHFAGTEHGLGIWPPTDIQTAPADPTGPVERSQNLRGVVDYSPLLRACPTAPRCRPIASPRLSRAFRPRATRATTRGRDGSTGRRCRPPRAAPSA